MTTSLGNIDNFNIVVLQLLAHLYESFPRPKNINPQIANSIGFGAVPQDATNKEAWEIGTMTEDVIEWLSEEGFIRYEPDPNHRYGYYGKVRLTLKGLTILGYFPTSLKEKEAKEPLIQKLKKAISSAGSSAGQESVKLVISEIFKLALAPGAVIANGIG